eukprot:snap_masked-scaffold_22-processed-gene-4.44-mRNA-1 protein AED:1.00 eAED:1.00 QI:0/0/0/0/1/1/2/0/299
MKKTEEYTQRVLDQTQRYKEFAYIKYGELEGRAKQAKLAAFEKAKNKAKEIESKVNNAAFLFHKPVSEKGLRIIERDAYWSENIWQDFKFYYANYSEPFSVCFQDKENPYRKMDKLVFFFSALCWSFFMACVLEGILFGEGGEFEGALSEGVVGIIIGLSEEAYSKMLSYIGICTCILKRENLPNFVVVLARCCGTCGSVLILVLLENNISEYEILDGQVEKINFDSTDRTENVFKQFFIAVIAARIAEVFLLAFSFGIKRFKQVGHQEDSFQYEFLETAGGEIIVNIVETGAEILTSV